MSWPVDINLETKHLIGTTPILHRNRELNASRHTHHVPLSFPPHCYSYNTHMSSFMLHHVSGINEPPCITFPGTMNARKPVMSSKLQLLSPVGFSLGAQPQRSAPVIRSEPALPHRKPCKASSRMILTSTPSTAHAIA